MNKPRLIDANAIIAEIKDWQQDIHDNEYDAEKYDFAFERIYEIIDEQPTAYDIDKVVEQLKQEQKNPNSYVYAWDAYYKAIEIVRNGGGSDV